MIVKKNNGFNGLFSTEDFLENTIIHRLDGPIYETPSRTTIEIGVNKHVDDEFGIYMNHSFEPNCIIKDECIVSLKSIKIGDELTFNYNENESSMSCPFIDNKTKKKVFGKIKC